ncbi:MAG: Antitoxin [Myxococcales bacterium]|nr:Antitoxin [Myxococcales bacterium]
MYTSFMRKKTYSVAQARAALPGILNEVSAGEDVYLTRRGQPVAVVLSTRSYERLSGRPATFSSTYRAFLETRGGKAVALDDAFVRALRARGPGRRVPL